MKYNASNTCRLLCILTSDLSIVQDPYWDLRATLSPVIATILETVRSSAFSDIPEYSLQMLVSQNYIIS